MTNFSANIVFISLYRYYLETMADGYLHGFSKAEQDRLIAQAKFLEPAIYKNITYAGFSNLLEIGCGVGGQTEILLRKFPHLKITAVDRSEEQLKTAIARVKDSRVTFKREDAAKLSFAASSFDSAFVCWLLEHVASPGDVLKEAFRVLKPGARIYCTEVLNATLFLHPYSPATLKYWFKFNDHQWELAGDPFVGAKLGNLLGASGFADIVISPITFHYDNRYPTERADMFKYWSDLLVSGTDSLLTSGRVSQTEVDEMKDELETLRKAQDSVFFYTSIQASATKR